MQPISFANPPPASMTSQISPKPLPPAKWEAQSLSCTPLSFLRSLRITLASYNTTLPGFANLPTFLRSTQHVNPTDASRTNWHHMRGLSRFDDLKQHPADMAIFQAVTSANAASKTPWTDLFPAKQLFDARKLDVPLMVDVGGGSGHDIERLRKRVSHTEPGALVLQDLKPVIERTAVHKSVMAMVHDFFEPQPIKGMSCSNKAMIRD